MRRYSDVPVTKNAFGGCGKRLSNIARLCGPDEEARMAAGEAALDRMVHSRSQVEREMEAEAAGAADEKDKTAAEVWSLSLLFTCPLTRATVTKGQRQSCLKEAILKRFEQDPVEASILMVHTFNRDRDGVKAAVDVISKYVNNVCRHPTEEKYRTIKVSNKVFQEKVHRVEGSREFLQALGFESVRRIHAEGEGEEEDEEYLVLPEQSADALDLMLERRRRLQRAEPEPLRVQLDRRPQAFRDSPGAGRFKLPPEFDNLTAEELEREQQQGSEMVTTLRERARRRYHYTVLRIRLPDGCLLQGTFYAWDPMTALFGFVRESLVDGCRPFQLFTSFARKLQESEDVALAECNLVPSSLLTFKWSRWQADIAGSTGKGPVLLKPQLLDSIQTLD